MLFKLDDLQFRLALDRAEAQLGNTRNDLLALQTSYRNMQAQIEQAKTDVDFATVNFKRQQQLAANNFTPQATFDATRNTLQGAQQKLASLKQQLAGIAANLNGNPDAPIEDHPRYKDALAARDEAARQLAHTVVRAPFAGIVTNVPSLQPGQYLAAAADGLQHRLDRSCLGAGEPEGNRADLCQARTEGDGRGRYLSGRSNGPARSTASARHRPRASRCCRRKTPAATGSRSCSAFRCACASTTQPASRRCASA